MKAAGAIALLASWAATSTAQTTQVEGVLTAANVRTRGAVAYLVPNPGGSFAALPETLMIDQTNLRFMPRVLVGQPGLTIRFRNSDPVFHNVFHPAGAEPAFDLGTYPRGEERPHTFTEMGSHVILCHVHPEMVAYVVTVPTPFHAVADRTGRFVIPDVPPGSYQLHIWHRRTRPFRRALVVSPGEPTRLELRLTRR